MREPPLNGMQFMTNDLKHEQLQSGKVIMRRFKEDGSLAGESHGHGGLEIRIQYDFEDGVKVSETYFAKRRMVSRRTYERARSAYPDMPPADQSLEDWGGGLLQMVRQEQRQRKEDAARRLAESVESRFPRPDGTNWLRVISGDKSHLVVFASRDWKFLSRERTVPTGREWLNAFGFTGSGSERRTVAMEFEIGFEVIGKLENMLNASRRLLIEINQFMQNPPEVRPWTDSFRPRRKPRRPPPPAWLRVLPPLIEFLSALHEPNVLIFNHHQ